jgi:hypothetical protein
MSFGVLMLGELSWRHFCVLHIKPFMKLRIGINNGKVIFDESKLKQNVSCECINSGKGCKYFCCNSYLSGFTGLA